MKTKILLSLMCIISLCPKLYGQDPLGAGFWIDYYQQSNQIIQQAANLLQETQNKNKDCSLMVVPANDDTFWLHITYFALNKDKINITLVRNGRSSRLNLNNYTQFYNNIFTGSTFRPGDVIKISCDNINKTYTIPNKSNRQEYYDYRNKRINEYTLYMSLITGNNNFGGSNGYVPTVSIVNETCSLCHGAGGRCPSCRGKGTIPHIIPYDGVHDPRNY